MKKKKQKTQKPIWLQVTIDGKVLRHYSVGSAEHAIILIELLGLAADAYYRIVGIAPEVKV